MFAKVGSWRGSFLVLVALAFVSMVLSLALATESKAAEGRKLDVPARSPSRSVSSWCCTRPWRDPRRAGARRTSWARSPSARPS
ncbi:hypothetical protein ACR6C2_34930 [Streptomyces sp. INA 01156]